MKKTSKKTTSHRPRYATATEAARRLEEIIDIMWDDKANDWRDHKSCADVVHDITVILYPRSAR